PQTGKGPSRNAETAKRLTGKALALSSVANILRSQTVVFQQNRRRADVRRRCEDYTSGRRKRPFKSSQPRISMQRWALRGDCAQKPGTGTYQFIPFA
ncbi:hypothetical protein, partial [Rhodovulum sulfidophilum]|uniref:hypothetical protein n=1 Tax=Rhodovulum sulfidophilum TaxID=35806 RepID=UPI001F30ECD2